MKEFIIIIVARVGCLEAAEAASPGEGGRRKMVEHPTSVQLPQVVPKDPPCTALLASLGIQRGAPPCVGSPCTPGKLPYYFYYRCIVGSLPDWSSDLNVAAIMLYDMFWEGSPPQY